MKQGYQVLEPDSIFKFTLHAHSEAYFEAVLKWVVHELGAELTELSDKVTVEVINVTYVSTYPAFGLKYHSENPEDLGPEVEAAIDRIIATRPVTDLIRFLMSYQGPAGGA